MLDSSPPFVHLRVHSAFSLAEGALKIPELMSVCQAYGMPAVALTDTGNLFGAMEFSLTAAKKGIQPILGCQLKVGLRPEDSRVSKWVGFPPTRPPLSIAHQASLTQWDTLVVLVQNATGYRNLIKLVSHSYLNQTPGDPPHLSWEFLAQHTEGLLALTGGLEGGIVRLLLQNNFEDAQQMLRDLSVLFPGRLYLEVTRQGLSQEDQIEPLLLKLGFSENIPFVATNEAFFLDEDMYEAHDALLCLAEGKYVSQTDRRRVTPQHRLRSPTEMQALFADLPEALANTWVIAQRCVFMLEACEPMLPPYPTDRSEKEELELQSHQGLEKRFQDHIFGSVLTDLTTEQNTLRHTYEERLRYELEVIDRMGYNGYFLIVADFIQWAKKNHIPVGPGRGSGAGSLVAWALTITDVDPLRFGLLFERFLNPERVSMPDFDVDFCQERRDEVINYVCNRHGKERVAQIITFGKLQARAALRDVGRVLGLPYGQVDKICKIIPNNPARPIPLSEAIAQEPQLKIYAQEDPMVEKTLEMAMKLEGLYRHASTHAAGVVIGDRPLDEIVPLYHDGKSAIPATQFHMKHVELAGLIKFDFLGLKTLSILQRAVDLVNEKRSEETFLELHKIPLDDLKTFEMLRNVDVMGVFQLESSGMREVLKRLQPSCFEEIIALIALYRPGPMDDIPRYLACKHGEEPVRYMHPLLEEILKETFGVMVYQEQVMEIARVLAGYSLGGADLLRRAMGKKIPSEMEAQRQIFIAGAQKNHVPADLAARIFEQVAKFAGYGFNKCHATPYALITYQTAYLKANFPVEFFAASMTFDLDNTDKLTAYRQELNRLGIPLLPPDINRSSEHFQVELLSSEESSENKWGVRYALGAIKNVGEGGMKAVVEARHQNGLFRDIFDFAHRLDGRGFNRRQLENLIMAGAFDTLHKNRAQLLENIKEILLYVGGQKNLQKRKKGALLTQQESLFGSEESTLFSTPKLRESPAWSAVEQLNHEFQAIGFYFSAHPLDSYQDRLQKLKLTMAGELEKKLTHERQTLLRMAGVIIGKTERTSKKGSRYAFLQLSDLTATYEVTVFSELLNRHADLFNLGAQVLLKVRGWIHEDRLRLTVEQVDSLEQTLASLPPTYTIHLEDVSALSPVKGILEQAGPGKNSIFIVLSSQKGEKIMLTLPQSYTISDAIRRLITDISGVLRVDAA